MRALIPLALLALLSACLPFGGRDSAAPREASPLAAGTVSVTSLDAPAPQGQRATPQSPPQSIAQSAAPAAPPQPAPQAGPAQGAAPAAAAAQPSTATDAAPTAEAPPPPPKTPMQIACERDGGRWARAGGSVAMTCFRPTRDGGKSCRRESDCSTLCLARSRTCAPVTPLFGCHQVLQNDGRTVNLCLD